jgi:hypothetical protein
MEEAASGHGSFAAASSRFRDAVRAKQQDIEGLAAVGGEGGGGELKGSLGATHHAGSAGGVAMFDYDAAGCRCRVACRD